MQPPEPPTPPAKPPPGKPTPGQKQSDNVTARKAREAAALRENLQRRKAQTRPPE